MSRRSTAKQRRGTGPTGFTLVEVLLVLGILVLLAAAAWPNLRRPLAATRLREAARGLCNELARARLRAIETGNVLELRYEPGRRRYEIVAQSAATIAGEHLAPTVNGGNAAGEPGFLSADVAAAQHWPAAPYVALREQLPSGVCFANVHDPLTAGQDDFGAGDFDDEAAKNVDDELGDAAFASDAEFPVASADVGSSLGSVAVYLNPDGTARDATIRLTDENGSSITIALRGMTGSTRLGEVTEPEMKP
ncbi:MAG: prepilin-type N-terminal cleavage/methylation domain-containing protein [Pirellulales bacterium]